MVGKIDWTGARHLRHVAAEAILSMSSRTKAMFGLLGLMTLEALPVTQRVLFVQGTVRIVARQTRQLLGFLVAGRLRQAHRLKAGKVRIVRPNCAWLLFFGPPMTFATTGDRFGRAQIRQSGSRCLAITGHVLPEGAMTPLALHSRNNPLLNDLSLADRQHRRMASKAAFGFRVVEEHPETL